MAIENHHELDAAALQRAAQEDPWQMHLIVRQEASASPAELIDSVIRGTLDCVARYEQDELHAEAFKAWFDLSFRKITLRAKEKEWQRLVDEFDGVADPSNLVFVMPPMLKSARDPFLRKLQVFSGELGELPKIDQLPEFPLRLVVNGDAGMSLGKTIAQASHAILILFRHIAERDDYPYHQALNDWIDGARPVAVAVEHGERFRAIDELPYVARVRDAGITEVVPGTHTVLIVPPGAKA